MAKRCKNGQWREVVAVLEEHLKVGAPAVHIPYLPHAAAMRGVRGCACAAGAWWDRAALLLHALEGEKGAWAQHPRHATPCRDDCPHRVWRFSTCAVAQVGRADRAVTAFQEVCRHPSPPTV